jgi:bacteriocin biosynthesis cyclodehydratase domain-containing protein
MTSHDVMAAVRYAKVKLPTKPRLATWFSEVQLGDDRIQLRSSDFIFDLNNKFLIEIFYLVRPLLDGLHTTEEIAQAQCEKFRPTTVIFFLKMLMANGLLLESSDGADDVDNADLEQLKAWDGPARLFARFTPQPWQVKAVLHRAHIALLGSLSLVRDIEIRLKALGIRHVIGINLPSLVENEPEMLRAHLTRTLMNAKELDLMVACLPDHSFAAFEAINTACLETSMRWMHLAIRDSAVVIGPTFIPTQTACYVCYDGRVKSNIGDVDSYNAFQKLRNKTSDDESEITPLWPIVSGQVALEIARILSGFAPPATIGRFFEIGAGTFNIRRGEILKVPRCPSCGPTESSKYPWGADRQTSDK